LENYFQKPSGSDDYDEREGAPKGPPRLTAIPPRRAENNPINLIKVNGDNFIVPEATMLLRPSPEGARYAAPTALGLDADPIGLAGPAGPPDNFGAMPDGNYIGAQDEPPVLPPLRTPSKSLSKRQKRLILSLSVAAAIIVIGTLIFSWNSGPSQPPAADPAIALSVPSDPQAADSAGSTETPVPADEIIKIAFLTDQNTHHYIENATEGTLLVLTGLVQNNTDKPISKLRIKGMLTDSQEKVVAERQVLAGNFLTEDELKVMPIGDILQRLSLNVGPSSNQVIAPSQTIRYMMVFNKLPSDLGMYLLEPMSYSDDTEAPPSS
jgi:hypothetical protein